MGLVEILSGLSVQWPIESQLKITEKESVQCELAMGSTNLMM